MKAPAFTLKLLAACLAGGALLASVPAHAGRDWDDRHYGRHEHRHGWDDHRGRGHKHGHHKERWSRHDHDHGHDRVVIRERVVVKQRPVVREYHYYDRPAPSYYDRPYYPYPRNPAITIGVDVPPIIIPLR